MPMYQFEHVIGGHGENCPCHDAEMRQQVAQIELLYPMAKAPKIDALIPCPVEGCPGKFRRIVSTGIAGIIKGKTLYDLKPNETLRANIGGEDVRFSFVDHTEHNDPYYRTQFARLAKASGARQGITRAYKNERHNGRICVDVVSNMPDPLGAIAAARSKAKRDGEYKTTRINVGQKYSTRQPVRKGKK